MSYCNDYYDMLWHAMSCLFTYKSMISMLKPYVSIEFIYTKRLCFSKKEFFKHYVSQFICSKERCFKCMLNCWKKYGHLNWLTNSLHAKNEFLNYNVWGTPYVLANSGDGSIFLKV